jgi:alkylhydroperoxidase family enzyme
MGTGGDTLGVFTTVAHHPKLLKRFLAFGTSLTFDADLPARDRELLILRTAANCRAEYEWGQHVAVAREVGLTDQEISDVLTGAGAPGWNGFDAALIRLADELHDDACASDETWGTLAERYEPPLMIEALCVVGYYHLVSFFLNSAGVTPEPGSEGLPSVRADA